jgi:opacity protein-like surface antigen
MKKFLVVMFAVALIFSASMVSAESLYVSGNIGSSINTDSTWEMPGVPDIDVQHNPGLAIGGAVGYGIGNSRGELEIGYRTNEIDEFEALGETVDGGGTVSAVSFMLNGYFDIANNSAFTPFVGGGIGIATVEIKDPEVDGEKLTGSEDASAFAYQAGLGLGYAVNDVLTIDGGYKYFGTSGLEFDDDVEVEYGSHTVYVGLRFAIQ